MTIVVWCLVVVALLPAFVPLTGGRATAVPGRKLRALAADAGLPLGPDLAPGVVATHAARERAMLIGGLAVAAAVVISALAFDWPAHAGSLVYLGALLGMCAGGVIAVLVRRRALLGRAPRVARATRTSVADYLSVWELLAARLSLLGAVVAVAGGAVVLRGFPGVGPGPLELLVLALGVHVVVVIAVEFTARAVLATPQVAASGAELGWDDVNRGLSLRSLFALPAAMGVGTPLVALLIVGNVVIDPDVRAGAMEETMAGGLVMFVVTLAVGGSLAALAIAGWVTGGVNHLRGRLLPTATQPRGVGAT